LKLDAEDQINLTHSGDLFLDLIVKCKERSILVGRSEGGFAPLPSSSLPPWTCKTILVENKLGIIHIVMKYRKPMGK